MTTPKLLVFAGLTATVLAPFAAMAQGTPADRQDAALAYAQCVRDNGYAEFPDPDSDGGFKFLIEPDSVARFKAATAACRDLAPEGMRGDEITSEEMDALLRLSQCVRENGVPEFPDAGPQGNFDLTGTGLQPGDVRLDAAMAACRDETGSNVRITIGG